MLLLSSDDNKEIKWAIPKSILSILLHNFKRFFFLFCLSFFLRRSSFSTQWSPFLQDFVVKGLQTQATVLFPTEQPGHPIWDLIQKGKQKKKSNSALRLHSIRDAVRGPMDNVELCVWGRGVCGGVRPYNAHKNPYPTFLPSIFQLKLILVTNLVLTVCCLLVTCFKWHFLFSSMPLF